MILNFITALEQLKYVANASTYSYESEVYIDKTPFLISVLLNETIFLILPWSSTHINPRACSSNDVRATAIASLCPNPIRWFLNFIVVMFSEISFFQPPPWIIEAFDKSNFKAVVPFIPLQIFFAWLCCAAPVGS